VGVEPNPNDRKKTLPSFNTLRSIHLILDFLVASSSFFLTMCLYFKIFLISPLIYKYGLFLKILTLLIDSLLSHPPTRLKVMIVKV
jgi:hypothetical protein